MHNTEYSSIFIPKQITVVVKDNQKAYIADSSNPKTLATAEMWANSNMFCLKDEIKPAEKLEYINDGFRLRILSATGNSSQSGKLSFWTCEVTAPDNRTFKVGVNSELMCELICSSCFINGKCQEDLKFGTRNNQWGFFSESMPAYKEYVKSQEIRDRLANDNTTKYKPGDIVRSLTESKLYVGEVYKYFEISCIGGGIYYPWQDNSIGDTQITIYKNPKKLYTFASSYKQDEYEICPDTGMLKKKPKRLLTGASFDHEKVKQEFYSALRKSHDEYQENMIRWRPWLLLGDLMYGDDDTFTQERIDNIKDRVASCIKYLVQSGQIHWGSSKKITYVIE